MMHKKQRNEIKRVGKRKEVNKLDKDHKEARSQAIRDRVIRREEGQVKKKEVK